MAATCGCFAFSTVVRGRMHSSERNPGQRFAVSSEQGQLLKNDTVRTHETTAWRGGSFRGNGSLKNKFEEAETAENPYVLALENDGKMGDGGRRKKLKDYFEESKELIRSDGGPPRWFSPLECGSRLDNSPLLLFLPGIDGVGLGLIMHHQALGKIFDIWCLHIPVKDRTSFTGLVKFVEATVRSDNYCSPNRPICIVGESLGACLALAVAARNPDIDLLLILANPGTSFEKSQLLPLISLLEIIPILYQLSLSYMLSSMTGDHLRMAMENVAKGLPLQQTAEGLSRDAVAMPSFLHVLADMLPKETLIWKLEMLKSASAFAKSRLHAVKAQTLILTSGRDQLLPSEEEGQRLRSALFKCEIRRFEDSGHHLFLEDGVDLGTIIKGASFYRRGKHHDYISDYIPPTPSEFKKFYESNRLIMLATSPVMLSTLEDGKIVKGLAGIPSEGPVLFIGYHMLLGYELAPMVSKILLERNILMRGVAHPLMFKRKKEGKLPQLSSFDSYRLLGAVPVSGAHLYNLLSSKAHVLLYPGGLREACHRKGEQYKLIWPEQSEFVRMAARFGAKIVPFGVVGEDDFGENLHLFGHGYVGHASVIKISRRCFVIWKNLNQDEEERNNSFETKKRCSKTLIVDASDLKVVFDYDDQMKVPFLRDLIKELSDETEAVRTGVNGEVNQDVHSPVVLPKFPGRFYYYFGKPIETEGRKHELRDKEKAHELYLEVRSEVEKCLAFLQEKRESDPYRSILARLSYQSTHGFDSEVPTFEL